MRFEIKSGGMAAIVVSIAALSGAVFMLGLLAGYDVGRESQSSAAQVATAYPVAAPPADAGAPAIVSAPPPLAAGTPSPAAHAVAPPPPVPPVKLATAKAAASKPPRPGTAATPSRAAAPPSRAAAPAARLPDKEPSSSAETGAPDEGTPDTADEDSGVPPNAPSASATPRPLARADTGGGAPAVPPRHKPYNIQIEAAMDRNGAGQMARRLQALGYQPHLVPAQMNGQTWYKVVIGPYPTQEAAAVAQQQMRTKYNSIYGGARSGDDSSPPTD